MDIQIARELPECKISPQGGTRRQQLRSLQKKLAHKKSKSHVKAGDIYKFKAYSIVVLYSIVVKQIDRVNMFVSEETIKVFRQAYYIAKENKPYIYRFYIN